MVIPLKVNTLLSKANLKKVKYNHDVYKLAIDSRLCTDNSLFVAINGNQVNGQIFIKDAIKNGAKTIISAHKCDEVEGINYVYVTNERKYLATLAKIFYGDISRKLKIIGVIGTNGKTTTATIAYNFLNYLHKKSMLIGTNGVFCDDYEANIDNTTPDILTIYQYLHLAKRRKVEYVFMEISSISVDQYRVEGLDFDCLIFTNFSQDHLDYHKSMEEYLLCKMVPFIKLKKNGYAIVNKDDEVSNKILKYCDANVITYGFKEKSDFLGTINYVNNYGVSFYAKNLMFKTRLLGEFNLYNTLSVLCLCDVYNISYLEYMAFIAFFKPVKGRMNRITYNNKNIIIDYAHTFLATKSVIEETLKLCKGKVYVVLGCGGNREKEKRGMIGSLLNKMPVYITLTSDNPRFENPSDIIDEIKKNIDKEVDVILDREDAILESLNKLSEGDYLLVLGKGCEKYIDIRGVKYPYSDLEVINEWIRNN